jgi:hypothetical protein
MTPYQRKQKRKLFLKRQKNMIRPWTRWWVGQCTRKEMQDRNLVYTRRMLKDIKRAANSLKKWINEVDKTTVTEW